MLWMYCYYENKKQATVRQKQWMILRLGRRFCCVSNLGQGIGPNCHQIPKLCFMI